MIEVQKPVNYEKLQNEFLAAQITQPFVVEWNGTTSRVHGVNDKGAWVDLPPAATPIVEAHDASVLTPTQQVTHQMRTACKNYAKQTNAEWAALTSDAKLNTTRDAVRALIRFMAQDSD